VIGVDNKDVLETAMRLPRSRRGDDPSPRRSRSFDSRGAREAENIELLADLDETSTQRPSSRTSADEAPMSTPLVGLPGTIYLRRRTSARRRAKAASTARPDLFTGRPWLLDSNQRKSDAVEKLSAFVRALGAEPRGGWSPHTIGSAFLSHLHNSPPAR